MDDSLSYGMWMCCGFCPRHPEGEEKRRPSKQASSWYRRKIIFSEKGEKAKGPRQTNNVVGNESYLGRWKPPASSIDWKMTINTSWNASDTNYRHRTSHSLWITIAMLSSTTLSLVLLANLLSFASSAAEDNHIYLDVKAANNTFFLESLRKLPLSTFRLANDKDRKRVGIIGHDLARIIPDAVSILPDHTLPSPKKKKKNGEEQTATTLRNFPSVNEPTVFMYSVGATQELAKMMERLQMETDDQMQQISSMFAEVNQFEHLLSLTTGENSTLRMKEAASKAAIRKNKMEMELLRAKHEQERAEVTKVAEEEQLRRSEEMTLARIRREDEAARLQAERAMLSKFEASQRIEKAKIEVRFSHQL